MKSAFLLFVLLTSFLSFGQANVLFASVDSKMSKIPTESEVSTTAISNYITSNFKTETDKIRAIYFWTASKIKYDTNKMLAPNLYETSQEKITNTLKSRTGVCSDYAEVFNEISNKVGIKCYLIPGYTKQNGKVATLAHAWCAAKIDNKWLLFDPTWASGAVNNGKFIMKFNEVYFKVDPSKMIATHIPFDYLWQFLNYPITNQEFYEGKIVANKTKKYFDFESEIKKYEQLSDSDKAFESASRIEKNGILNALISEQYKYKKNEFTILTQNINSEKLTQEFVNYNQAVALLNDFIMYRNKKFKPSRMDEEMKDNMQNIKDQFKKCEDGIYTIGSLSKENISGVIKLKNLLLEINKEVQKQDNFLKEYLGKNSVGRKMMFSNFKMKT